MSPDFLWSHLALINSILMNTSRCALSTSITFSCLKTQIHAFPSLPFHVYAFSNRILTHPTPQRSQRPRLEHVPSPRGSRSKSHCPPRRQARSGRSSRSRTPPNHRHPRSILRRRCDRRARNRGRNSQGSRETRLNRHRSQLGRSRRVSSPPSTPGTQARKPERQTHSQKEQQSARTSKQKPTPRPPSAA